MISMELGLKYHLPGATECMRMLESLRQKKCTSTRKLQVSSYRLRKYHSRVGHRLYFLDTNKCWYINSQSDPEQNAKCPPKAHL